MVIIDTLSIHIRNNLNFSWYFNLIFHYSDKKEVKVLLNNILFIKFVKLSRRDIITLQLIVITLISLIGQ
jgi:hypothetical protein